MEDQFTILSASKVKAVDARLKKNPTIAPSAKNGHHSLDRDQLLRLQGNQADSSLDEGTIDFFMHLLVRAMHNEEYRVVTFPANHASVMTKDVHVALANLPNINKAVIYGLDAIFLPYLEDGSWTLAVAKPQENRLLNFQESETPASELYMWMGDREHDWNVRIWGLPYDDLRKKDSGVLLCYKAALWGLEGRSSQLKHVSEAEIREMRYWLLYTLMKGEIDVELLEAVD